MTDPKAERQATDRQVNLVVRCRERRAEFRPSWDRENYAREECEWVSEWYGGHYQVPLLIIMVVCAGLCDE